MFQLQIPGLILWHQLSLRTFERVFKMAVKINRMLYSNCVRDNNNQVYAASLLL